jgi:hypothetical protein
MSITKLMSSIFCTSASASVRLTPALQQRVEELAMADHLVLSAPHPPLDFSGDCFGSSW